MIYTNTKIAIRKRIHRVAKLKIIRKLSAKRNKHEEISQLLTEVSSDTGSGFETSKEDGTQQQEKNWESSDEREKMLGLKYLRGAAAYRSVNLQKRTNLKQSEVKILLEGKNAQTKHKKHRKKSNLRSYCLRHKRNLFIRVGLSG